MTRFSWYEKPALLAQRMFDLPVLGWVTVYQFVLVVGVGMPGMFVAINAAGIYAAPWPLLATFLFAKFRPPLQGYETRAYHMWRFRVFGPKEKKAGPKPRAYVMPRATRTAEAPEPDEPLEITVYDRPRELRMALPPGTPAGKRVEVRLDGVPAGTPHPDSDGTVHLVLYPDDMRGERTVTIHDGTGAQIAGRVLVFMQGV